MARVAISSAEAWRRQPGVAQFRIRSRRQHPFQQAFRLRQVAAYGKQPCRLQIAVPLDVFRSQSAPFQPFQHRAAQQFHRRVAQRSPEGVFISVGAHRQSLAVAGHQVHTLPPLQFEHPVVLRHSRHHILLRQLPSAAHVRVLQPDVFVGFREQRFHPCILREYRRLLLHLLLQDFPLVLHQVLQRQRRRQQFRCRSEVVEFPARQRQHRHTQPVDFLVLQARMLTHGAAEFAVEVIGHPLPLFVVGAPAQHLHRLSYLRGVGILLVYFQSPHRTSLSVAKITNFSYFNNI